MAACLGSYWQAQWELENDFLKCEVGVWKCCAQPYREERAKEVTWKGEDAALLAVQEDPNRWQEARAGTCFQGNRHCNLEEQLEGRWAYCNQMGLESVGLFWGRICSSASCWERPLVLSGAVLQCRCAGPRIWTTNPWRAWRKQENLLGFKQSCAKAFSGPWRSLGQRRVILLFLRHVNRRT